MKRLFKTVDEKLDDLGFKKTIDNNYSVIYERTNEKYHCTQVLAILHKKSGKHIIQSYDKNLFDIKNIGNTCIGLTYCETKLALKKMKEKGWNKEGGKHE